MSSTLRVFFQGLPLLSPAATRCAYGPSSNMTKKYSILQSLILFGIVTCGVSASFAADGPKIDFKRSFEVSFTDHITLDVAVPEGDVNIEIGRASCRERV